MKRSNNAGYYYFIAGNTLLAVALGLYCKAALITQVSDLRFLGDHLYYVFGLTTLYLLGITFTSKPARSALHAILTATYVVINFVQLASYGYFKVTGVYCLGFRQMVAGVLHFRDIAPVIFGENSWYLFLVFLVIAGTTVFSSRLLRSNEPARSPSLLAFYACAVSFSVVLTFLPARMQNDKDAFVVFVAGLYRDVCAPQPAFAVNAPEKSGSAPDRSRKDPALARFANRNQRVVLIILESTNAKSTSIYGGVADTTPFLARLARQSLVYNHAYAVVPHTSKALVAMLQGVYPDLTDNKLTVLHEPLLASGVAALASEHKIRTVFFQSATKNFENREQLIGKMKFDEFFSEENYAHAGFERANYFGYEDDIMLAKSRSWLESNRHDPFLAVYLTSTPHTPYLAPKRYGIKQYTTDGRKNGYLNSVNYLDNFVKNLIDQYKKLSLYEDTVFIITGDHGEGFAEHGRMIHDDVIYNEGLHVPLLIHKYGALDAARKIDANVSLLDVAPTILDLLGIDHSSSRFDGVSLLAPQPNREIFSSCFIDSRCIALLDHGYKYIHHFGNQADELFDIDQDPLEISHVNDAHQEVARDMRSRVLSLRDQIKGRYEQASGGN